LKQTFFQPQHSGLQINLPSHHKTSSLCVWVFQYWRKEIQANFNDINILDLEFCQTICKLIWWLHGYKILMYVQCGTLVIKLIAFKTICIKIKAEYNTGYLETFPICTLHFPWFFPEYCSFPIYSPKFVHLQLVIKSCHVIQDLTKSENYSFCSKRDPTKPTCANDIDNRYEPFHVLNNNSTCVKLFHIPYRTVFSSP